MTKSPITTDPKHLPPSYIFPFLSSGATDLSLGSVRPLGVSGERGLGSRGLSVTRGRTGDWDSETLRRPTTVNLLVKNVPLTEGPPERRRNPTTDKGVGPNSFSF